MMLAIERTRERRALLTALLTAALIAAGASTPVLADQPTCREPDPRSAAADELARLAELEIRNNGSWDRAAWLLVHSANMRPRCDRARLETLRTAARYYHFAGDDLRASRISFEAGEHGVWTGHVTEAAESFIDAATFALEAGDAEGARIAADHAMSLGDSPLLGAPQRLSIRGRAESVLASIEQPIESPHGHGGPRPGSTGHRGGP